MPSSYYNIDTILAQEDLIPCTNLFDFARLEHLDASDGGVEHHNNNKRRDDYYLPEKSPMKMPLWAIGQWAALGFIRISMPKHFSRRYRERLAADPAQTDLRKINERFYLTGHLWIELTETTGSKSATATVLREATELRKTLLSTYTGERLTRTLDLAMANSSSSSNKDNSFYTKRLTGMEMNLYNKGASAAAAHAQWKQWGNRRIQVTGSNGSGASMTGGLLVRNATTTRTVTPPNPDNNKHERHVDKRQRVS